MDKALLVAIGFLAGIVVGGFAVGSLVPTATDGGDHARNPPSSYVTTTSPDVESVLVSDRGWIHEVHVEDDVVVTGNATVVHDGNQSLRLNITRTGPGTYELAFETVPREDGTKGGEGDVASTIDWGVEFPTDYESYVVSVDGIVVKRVTNDEATTARLMHLPHPLAG